MRELQAVIERGIARGEVDLESVFDTHYIVDARDQLRPSTSPSLRVRRRPRPPVLDTLLTARTGVLARQRDHRHQRLSADPLTARSQARRADDPEWNAEHCRNRRPNPSSTTTRHQAGDR